MKGMNTIKIQSSMTAFMLNIQNTLMPRGMINVPGVAPAPLEITSLENSFENLGRTMVDVLTMQQPN